MWNDRLQRHADQMKLKFARTAKSVRSEAIPGRWKASYAHGRGVYDKKRLEPLRIAREKQQAQAEARKAVVIEIPVPTPVIPEVVDPLNLPSRFKLGRPAGVKTMAKDLMPVCPRCGSGDVKRAGVPRGHQRFRCQSCKRTFGGFTYKEVIPLPKHGLVCYRCGSKDVKPLGFSPCSGRIGYCRSCRQRFTQGGRNELARYHICLEARVKELRLPQDIQAELLQIAYHDVLLGEGYCWNIHLDQKQAWRAARGSFMEEGSLHAEYVRQAEGGIVIREDY